MSKRRIWASSFPFGVKLAEANRLLAGKYCSQRRVGACNHVLYVLNDRQQTMSGNKGTSSCPLVDMMEEINVSHTNVTSRAETVEISKHENRNCHDFRIQRRRPAL